ncbi:alpha/beta hydrolase [Microvirga antarctica]|uniref:alpha/beta hydrolase n=1 Tax=Microvirga antarctica TaxID=2819233 RepID=UPI001B300E1F|nr:dienelactone hydrolase family protein [Microvirga antarctica]
MPRIDGPRLAPKSGRTKQLVVFLHGLGADGDDLIALGQEWRDWLPDAAFVAPHAPDPCEGAPMGRQWFPLTLRDPAEFWRGVTYAAPALDSFLDAELLRHGLDASHLALVGFSQGAMMALHVGLRRRSQVAAIVGFSGLLVMEHGKGPESLTTGTATRPPIFLTHGDSDEVLPVEMFFYSKEALASAEIACQWHLSAGMGHGIDGEALRQAGLFLTQSFGLPYPA